MEDRNTTTAAATIDTTNTKSMEETTLAMVETGDRGIANLEIQCSIVDIGDNNDHHPSLDNPDNHGGEDNSAVGLDASATKRLSPTTTTSMGLSFSLSPTGSQLPVPPGASSTAKQTTGNELLSNQLPSTTSTTESTATTAATSDCFLSIASSTMNVSSTGNAMEAPSPSPMGSDDDPLPGNKDVVPSPTTFIDPPAEMGKALPLETNDSSATSAATEPLGQSTTMIPPQSSMVTTTVVDGNETKEGIHETGAAAKLEAGDDQAQLTGQEGQDPPLPQQQQQQTLEEEKEKEEGKSRKDDSSIDTPPIPLEVSSNVNQDHSEYDEELEFDASDDSSEGQLSSDDEIDYIIDPNDFQMGENEPVIIIGVPSMQDTEPSQ